MDFPVRERNVHVSPRLLPASVPLSLAAEKRARVLLFDHTAIWSGGEIALYNLVQNLDKTRFTPIVALCDDGPLAQRLRESGIETHILPLAPSVTHAAKDSLGISSLLRLKDLFRVLCFIFTLARFIKSNQIDLVHTNSLKSDLLGGFAGRLAGVPVLWHIRDRIEDDYLPGPVVRAFRLLCRFLPNYLVTNSQATLHTVLPALQDTTREINETHLDRRYRVVYDGTPVRELVPPPARSIPRIGLVGRISAWKGQHVFLQSARIVHACFPEARFQIIGGALFNEKEYEQSLYQMVEELGLQSCVEFTGFRNDVPALMAELDILVHASITGEPFGQVVIEGMMTGIPVVATRGGGIPEIVEEGRTGMLVPMGDAQAMASAICSLLNDKQRAAAMGLRGYQRARDHFDIALTARRVEAVYERLLTR
jgi:glycosyltransferase involved in cell wall biosynthesis